MKLSERVAVIEDAIAECNRTAKAIVAISKVKFGEQLTGVNKEAWDAQNKMYKELTQWLKLAEGYIRNAENLLI